MLIFCPHSISKAMRPSSILTFEPGLESGVPWGRDLFTFVTSAAGHMMRTLQRPRKNKPSKRQVNHRRFLHNMIQRKFAEIEAANHQLASALFATDKPPDHLTPRLSHIVTEVTDQSPKPSKKAIETFINADKTEALPEQQEDVCDLWTLDSLLDTHVADKSFSPCKFSNSRGRNPRTDKDGKGLKNNPASSMEKDIDFSFSFERQPASTDLESLTQMNDSLLEDSMSSWFGSIERTRTYSKPHLTKYHDVKFLPTDIDVQDLSPPSPVISLLSLDSCDLEVQMLIDAEHNVNQMQDATIVESLQMDMVDDLDLLDKMAEWMDHSEKDGRCLQETCAFPSSLDSDLENLTGSGGGATNSMSTLGQTGHSFFANVLCSQEPHRRSFHHDQINYAMNHNIILEDRFGQVEPCMKTNGKEDCYLDTDFSVMDGNVSSNHMFPGFERQLDQSKRILHDDWEQQPLKSSYKNYTSPDQIMIQETDIRNVDKNTVQVENLNQTLSGPQCPITCCLEGVCYHKEDSCFYTKFRGSHNFEGVARSFPATLHKLHPTPIQTPPLDDDWLFGNIVAEEEVNSMNNTFGKY
ncbi:uncharacterized protein LOC107748923 isoform X1 [Sinocyclocheilus rhinocerous]|uniref:uncharacterized protein LOC107748923 isoform X1 n=2 Tax=Sinocyclocheilus rhinocerous TaxID=307959 RepID=UPI0007B7D1C8|nr:PREDICTED: uncharacterized protein LOC107748923 isoform X1 [Sinocyclocheilus rhinocerous]XP_016419429.1 PREDICTED: uncharacterized protein LOC107748923 isoform X1 [Sinocyclocheilus rhinocerous]